MFFTIFAHVVSFLIATGTGQVALKGRVPPSPWHSSVFVGLIVLYTPLGYLYYIPPLGICQVVFIKSFVDKLVSYFYFSYSELLGHRMAEHPKFPLNTDHSISAPLRISPHYTIRIAQADPLQTIHLTVMP